MTALVLLVLLALFWLAGLGPTLLLMRRSETAPRLLVAPFAGIAAFILCFFALLPLNLTGTSTAALTMVLLAAVSFAGILMAPPSLRELRETLLVLLVGAGGFLLCGWPYLTAGFREFIGYGNPDVPFLVSRIKFLADNPVLLPDSRLYRGLDPGGIVGLLFFSYPLALLTKADVRDLFSTCCAAVVALAPASVYVLCRLGLELDRTRSIVIAGVAAVSSLLSYTFYLHSLGTLTVMVGVPVALAVALACVRTKDARAAVVLGILLGGALYNYGAGFAVYGAFCGAATCSLLFESLRADREGSASRKQIAWVGGCVALAIALPSYRYVASILSTTRSLSDQSRLAGNANELQTGFALVLTERGFPYFWGLMNPWSPKWFGRDPASLTGLLIISLFLTALVVIALYRQVGGSSAAFRLALAGAGLLTAYFYARGVAYGVFKLTVWIHYPFLVALGAGVFLALQPRSRRWLRVAFSAALLAYFGLNALTTLQLSRFAAGLDGALLSSTPGLRLSDMRVLEHIPADGTVLVGLADSVTRLWARPFLGNPHLVARGEVNFYDEDFHFLSELGLLVEDSQPLAFLPDCNDQKHAALLTSYHLTCSDVNAQWFLDWNPKYEPESRIKDAVWTSKLFALAKGVPADTIIPARGWYRRERLSTSGVAWQRDFRWVRKRAEVFVLHPTPSPKRLHMVLVPGYGSSSDQRHVELVMNGKVLQRISINGYRDITTEPFTIPGPVSQLEIAVEEDVQPASRSFALWNSWVPADGRRLNIAVANLQLREASDEGAAIPNELHFDRSANDWPAFADGISADLWVGEKASVRLRVSPGSRWLELKGTLPGNTGYKLPFNVQFSNGREVLGTGRIGQFGPFQLRILLTQEFLEHLNRDSSIDLLPAATFQPSSLGSSADRRHLSFQIHYIGFGPAA